MGMSVTRGTSSQETPFNAACLPVEYPALVDAEVHSTNRFFNWGVGIWAAAHNACTPHSPRTMSHLLHLSAQRFYNDTSLEVQHDSCGWTAQCTLNFSSAVIPDGKKREMRCRTVAKKPQHCNAVSTSNAQNSIAPTCWPQCIEAEHHG